MEGMAATEQEISSDEADEQNVERAALSDEADEGHPELRSSFTR